MPATAFTDGGGNNPDNAIIVATAANAPFDTAPTVSIAAFTGALTGPQTAIITLSEDSTDFVIGSLTRTNATIALTGSGRSYTAVLTPIADGSVALSVAIGAFTDATGNANTAASNEVISTVDITAPTVSIAAFTGPLNGPQTAIITLSEDSTDFVVGSLTRTNATIALTGSGSSYTAVLTLVADGSVALSVAIGAFTDATGNANTAASNEVISTIDITAPTVSIAAFTGALTGPQTAIITLSEDSTDFVVGSLTPTNATVALTGSGSDYTAVLTPIADGPVALSVAANTFADADGNTNTTASNVVTTVFDGTPPTVVLSSTTTTISGTAPFSVNVTFDEDVTGFASEDITVTNGAFTRLTGVGAAYVATISGAGGGVTIDISVAASMATDLAGNDNTASNTLSIGGVTVEETQRLIAQFQQSRATQLISNQPNLTGFLSGEGNGGAFNADVTRGSGTFNFATRQDEGTTSWFRINGSVTSEGTADTNYLFGAVGSHFSVSPNLLIGGLLEIDYLKQDNGTSSIEGKGWLAGPYFVAKLAEQPVFFEGRLLYGQTSNDISPIGTFTDSFDTDRILAQLEVCCSTLLSQEKDHE